MKPQTPHETHKIDLDGEGGAHQKIKDIAAYEALCEKDDYERNTVRV